MDPTFCPLARQGYGTDRAWVSDWVETPPALKRARVSLPTVARYRAHNVPFNLTLYGSTRASLTATRRGQASGIDKEVFPLPLNKKIN